MIGKIMRANRGTVLVVAMLLMTTLAIIGIAANTNVVTDTGIASNYLSSLQSFYMAEAGLEHGKIECAERFHKNGWSDFTTILRGPDDTAGTADDGILSFGSAVPFHGGRYAVRVTNDAGDLAGAATDSNATITLVSKGSYGRSETTVSCTITMNALPALSGSINLTGHASTRFVNDSFLIDGRDYLLSDLTHPRGTSAARSGISISDVPSLVAAKDRVIASLSADQADNVNGDESTPSIGLSTTLNRGLLKQFVDAMKRVADNRITPSVDTLSTSGPDNSVTVGAKSYSLGTAADPKITYISKPAGGAVTLGGTGCGILIVEGNNLLFKPDLHYTGLTILVGNKVALDDSGSAKGLQMAGSLVIADFADPPEGFDLTLSGNSRILYSQEAIEQAKNYLQGSRKYTVLSWQRSY